MRKTIKRLAAAIALTALAYPAAAQDSASTWPARTVTLVVPYSAGGPVDTVARIMTARLSELLDQQIIVENMGGPAA